MEFSILYAIQDFRCGFLDDFFLILTKAAGNYGQLWVYIAVLLLIFKNTRKAGVSMLISYGLVFLIGQKCLKEIFDRVRPCNIDTAIEMLVSRPTSGSFPSTHAAWALAGSFSILFENKKLAIPAIVLAVLIAFSRLYMFVHFPTDVVFGALFGIGIAFCSDRLVRWLFGKFEKKHA